MLQGSSPCLMEMLTVGRVPSSPTLPNISAHAKMHDMRLFHHYCTVTIETLGAIMPVNTDIVRVWQKEVPQLAFEHDFLMDNLLALASVHMDLLNPQSANLQLTALYQDRALHGFRKAVAHLSKGNFLAIIVASTLLSPSSLVVNRKLGENRLWSIDWLVMHTGLATILDTVDSRDVLESCIAPLFNIKLPDPAPTLIPTSLQHLVNAMKESGQDATYNYVLRDSIVCLGGLYGRITQYGLNPTTAIDIMRWPYAIPSRFQQYTRQRLPHALIVLAHFIVLFELLPQLWWVSDVAEHEVNMISDLLAPEWQHFIAFPRMAVGIKDQARIFDLLLAQLPATCEIISLPMERLSFHVSQEYVNPKKLDQHSTCRDVDSKC